MNCDVHTEKDRVRARQLSLDGCRNYEGLHREANPDPILQPLDEGAALRTTRHPYRVNPRRAIGSADAWLAMNF